MNYSATSTGSRPRLPKPSNVPLPRTNILLLGLRKAGKTSIQQVLFNHLPPKQTFYLEPTMRIVKHQIDTVIPIELWDCPANTTVESLGVPLSQFSTLIFVIDIRDLYNQAISKLVDFIVASYAENPEIALEVFVHKAEKLQEDDKIENFRQIHERVSDRLLDISPDYEQMQLNFHLTSVYDHSLHEAFSRVLHKLIDSLPYLEELLNVFCANSQSPKAFLFDTRSRLYIATDMSPVDSATHNLCCDYLLMINSFGPLYKSISASPARQRHLWADSSPSPPPDGLTATASNRPHSPRSPSGSQGHLKELHFPPNSSSWHPPSSPSSPKSNEVRRGQTPGLSNTLSSSQLALASAGIRNSAASPSKKDFFYPSASTTLATPSLPSGGSTTLTYHLITNHLALLALIPTTVYEERRGLVEYNVVFFREGVQEICDAEVEVRASA